MPSSAATASAASASWKGFEVYRSMFWDYTLKRMENLEMKVCIKESRRIRGRKEKKGSRDRGGGEIKNTVEFAGSRKEGWEFRVSGLGFRDLAGEVGSGHIKARTSSEEEREEEGCGELGKIWIRVSGIVSGFGASGMVAGFRLPGPGVGLTAGGLGTSRARWAAAARATAASRSIPTCHPTPFNHTTKTPNFKASTQGPIYSPSIHHNKTLSRTVHPP